MFLKLIVLLIKESDKLRCAFLVFFIVSAITFAGAAKSRLITDNDWDVMNQQGILGCNGEVRTVVNYKGIIYFGGSFSITGNIAARNIAAWDGTRYFSFGQGVDTTVLAIAFDSSGSMYVGGDFKTAGGIPAAHIAKWDGTSWASCGSGVDSSVYALACMSSGEMVAGGRFASAGGAHMQCIAQWNGVSWRALGGEIQDPYNKYPLCIDALAATPHGTLFAGGSFCYIGEKYMLCIAEWNGTTWDSLSRGMDDRVRALTLDKDGNLLVGGSFGVAGHQSQIFLSRWNGTAWDSLASNLWYAGNSSPFGVYSIAIDNQDRVMLGGYFEEFSDNSRNTVKTGSGMTIRDGGGRCYGLAFDSDGKLFAGGDFGIEVWNDTSWKSPNHCGMDGPVNSIACSKTGEVYVGGRFTVADSFVVNHIARWDNGAWSGMGAGVSDSYSEPDGIEAVACDSSGNVIIGGKFITVNSVPARYVARWNGEHWAPFASQLDLFSHQLTEPCGVFSLICAADGSIYAGGFFNGSGGVPSLSVARWHGDSWQLFGVGIGGNVFSMTLDGKGNLYAGGFFYSAGDVPCAHMARWDGTAWDSLTLNDDVRATVSDGKGTVYAGGLFTEVFSGGIPQNAGHVAAWDGSRWDTLAGGCNGHVNALTLDKNGYLWVGGKFTTAGGRIASNIARWDGVGWSSPGSGTTGEVKTLAFRDGVLYAGGNFTMAGNRVSPYIALLRIGTDLGTSRPLSPSKGPNPFSLSRKGKDLILRGSATFSSIELYSFSGKRLLHMRNRSDIRIALPPQPVILRVSGPAVGGCRTLVLPGY